MAFAETKSYSETRKRGSDSYVKFADKEKIVLRMLSTEARQVWKHWIPEANGGKGLMAVCPNTARNKICPIEKSLEGLSKEDETVKERKAKGRFIVNVLDRTPVTVCNSCNQVASGKICKNCGADIKKNEFVPVNKVKILEGGPRLFRETLNGIDELQTDEMGVAITEYDIIFTTQGVGRERKINAIPGPVEPLNSNWLVDPETGEPQRIFNIDDLSEPTTIEEINAMLRGATLDELNAIRGVV